MPPTSTGRTSRTTPSWFGRSSSPSTRSECGRTSPSSRSVRACSRSPGASSGLTWTPVTDAPTWHPEVATYDVGFKGRRIGRIHLDLHPRDGKYKHAAQFDLVRGVRGVQLPEGRPRVQLQPGPHGARRGRHALPRVRTPRPPRRRRRPGMGPVLWSGHGVGLRRGTEPDAGGVGVGRGRPRDVRAQRRRETIPAELVAAMRRADDFGKGYDARTQMFYAALSYDFHVNETDDLTARLTELMRRYSVFPYIEGTHMQCHFGHLDGYSSGYYTYMWSLVIAKDMFSAFDRASLFDPGIAGAYRDKVLAPGGGRRDAAVLVEDFLGRPTRSTPMRPGSPSEGRDARHGADALPRQVARGCRWTRVVARCARSPWRPPLGPRGCVGEARSRRVRSKGCSA